MNTVLSMKRSRIVLVAGVVLIAIALLTLPEMYQEWREEAFEGKARIRESGQVSPEVVNSSPFVTAKLPALAPPSGYTPQLRLGFPVDNEWEPAIASDRFGHVYVLYPQYGGVPGCPACYSPTMILQISSDGGTTWASPTVIYPEGSDQYQVDAQIVVDPVDGQTVYAAWLQNNKSAIAVAKSTDFGAHWSVVLANSSNAGQDKDILAVRGQEVYVVYNHSQTMWASVSHDGGATFTSVKVNQNGKLGWSLAGGGTITPDGVAYFAWDGYEGSGGAKSSVNLYISKSTDQGATWTTRLLDISSSPPDCSDFSCGWAFLGAAITMTSDSSGTLYALWNAGSSPRGPERIYFSRSSDAGVTWTPRQDVSLAPAGSHHAFPAIAAAGPGAVRVAWMDGRAANGGMDRWNVYVRSSTNSGNTWSAETDISTYVSGFSYIFNNGFRFPFGDYFEMDIDNNGLTHLIWGEGYSYDSPGSIWYSQGR
jgi:BNR repeat protein